jgi:hypothetical protein
MIGLIRLSVAAPVVGDLLAQPGLAGADRSLAAGGAGPAAGARTRAGGQAAGAAGPAGQVLAATKSDQRAEAGPALRPASWRSGLRGRDQLMRGDVAATLTSTRLEHRSDDGRSWIGLENGNDSTYGRRYAHSTQCEAD